MTASSASKSFSLLLHLSNVCAGCQRAWYDRPTTSCLRSRAEVTHALACPGPAPLAPNDNYLPPGLRRLCPVLEFCATLAFTPPPAPGNWLLFPNSPPLLPLPRAWLPGPRPQLSGLAGLPGPRPSV